MKVRIVVPARNEQQRLGALLRSVKRAIACCEARGDYECSVLVVLDRCDDASEATAQGEGVHTAQCPPPFGKVEALRAGMDSAADVHIFVDADVVLGERTLRDLLAALEREPTCLAACPPLAPEPVAGVITPLAWALHRYNRTRGFSSQRLWLSGRCYAVRGRIDFPDAAEVRTRAARVTKTQRVPGLAMPLIADDIWLSRMLLAQHPAGILHIETDPVVFRAPDSLRGMSRTWRRLRRELRRVDLLFPELPGKGRRRRTDSVYSAADALALGLFHAALWLCEVHARVEDSWQRVSGHAPDPWPVVRESKA